MGACAWACPDDWRTDEPPATATARTAHIARLRALADACLDRADYHARLGLLLLQAGRAPEAVVELERSLLLDDDQPGVQLDFVLALAQSGDLASARALAQEVLSRPDVPDSTRRALIPYLQPSRLQSLQNTLNHGWSPWRGAAQSLIGQDTNLNSATSADSITLTLPNGNIPLTIDGSARPRKGTSAVESVQLMRQRQMDDGLLHVEAGWRERLAPGNAEFGYRQLDASAYYRPDGDQRWSQRYGITHFTMNGATLYQGLSASLWREHNSDVLSPSLATCRHRYGLEGERRNFVQDSTQSGLYAGGLLALLCASGPNQYQLSLQSGHDWRANDQRAGGDQTRTDLRLQWQHMAPWGRSHLDWTLSRLDDSQSYSTLLGGDVRHTRRQTVRWQVTKRLHSVGDPFGWGGWYWVGSLEWLRFDSNVELFNLRGRSVHTGVRYEF